MPDLQPLMPYATFIGGAIALLLILFLFAALFRRSRKHLSRTKGNRLGISEYYEIDETRRLVLVRRDKVEHLVLIGGPKDVVIESGIGAVIADTRHPLDEAMSAAVSRSDDVLPFKAAPRAPVFGIKRPGLRAIDDQVDGDNSKS